MTGNASSPHLTVRQLVQRHSLLAGLVGAYLLTSYLVSSNQAASVHDEKAFGLFLSFLIDVPMMVFFVLLWRILELTYVQKTPNRLAVLASDVRLFLSERDRVVGGLMTVCIMAGTLVAFAQLKNLIPTLHPYSWDEYFMQLDRTLHFGVQPYRIAHAILGWNVTITAVSGLYNFWLFMMYFVLLGACFMRPENSFRMQFLIAFLFTWAIGGNLFATIFSSAGPAYYAMLGLGDNYSELMGILRNHAATGAITVVNTQDLLWQVHTAKTPINMISAFPSMHVASSVLMAIFLSRLSRWLGIFAWLFALGIMIGSVLLAWHYAVDGYAGALIAVASWYAAGWLVRLTSGSRSGQLIPTAAQT